jgi:predicted Zn-dependent peptidase
MKEPIQISRLPNGLTLLSEKMADVRSATLGFWYRCGSRDEPAHLNGISHFIEHTVFKGTRKRTALDIAIETDRLGGTLDAFTMHEQTGFTIKVTDSAVDRAFDLLADMLTGPLFDETELAREQKVIVEEMKMVEDSPEEFLAEIFQQNFFAGSGLGLPIEGTKDTVLTFDSAVTAKYHREVFAPHNLVIAAAGNVEHDQIVELASKFFGEGERTAPLIASEKSAPAKNFLLTGKPGLEQTHFIIALPWIEEASERRYAGHLLETIFGQGISSRLWQKIREERGLAYSVGASGISYRDRGTFNIFAATSPEHFTEAIDLATKEMKLLKDAGVTADELALAKEQTVAGILLSLEDSGVRATNLAQQEIVFGRQIPLEETLRRIDAVTVGELSELVDEFFRADDLVLTALGEFDGSLTPEEYFSHEL